MIQYRENGRLGRSEMKKRPNGPRNLKAGGFTNGLWRLEERERKLKMAKLPDFEENRKKWERKAERNEWERRMGVERLSKVEERKAKLKAEKEAKAEARKKLREPPGDHGNRTFTGRR